MNSEPANFSQAAAHYKHASPIQALSAQILLEYIKRTYSPNDLNGQLWLDAGCGPGTLACALSHYAPDLKLLALDQSAEMLAQIPARENIQPILADLNALKSNTLALPGLDGIVSNFALHWLGSDFLPYLLNYLKAHRQAWLAIPVEGSLNELALRFPALPLFKFEPANCFLEVFNSYQSQYKITHWQQNLTHLYPSLAHLLKNLKQMGGTRVQQRNHTGNSIHQLRAYLRQVEHITLNYQVLFLVIDS